MAHEVYISYSRTDKVYADALCAALEAAQIRCWIDRRDLIHGMDFLESLTNAIENSRVMVLIFSEHSNMSPAVLSEVETAVNAGVHILNFRLDNSKLSPSLRFRLQHLHWLDAMTPPMEQHHAELIRSVKALLGMDPTISGPKRKKTEKRGRVVVLETFFTHRAWKVAGGVVALATIWLFTKTFPFSSKAPNNGSPSILVLNGYHSATSTFSPVAEKSGIWRVNPGESIQAALKNASSGETVSVAAGEYVEQLKIDKPGIKLIGDSKETTIIRCSAKNDSVLTIIGCDNGEIAGLCFEHLASSNEKAERALVAVRDATVTMHDCIVRNTDEVGIYLDSGSKATIENCEISKCQYGILVRGPKTAPTLKENHILYNKAYGICLISCNGLIVKNKCESNGVGIIVFGDAAALTLTDNKAKFNSGCGIYLTDKTNCRVIANHCEENEEHGIGIFGVDTAPVFSNNECKGNAKYGIYVEFGAKPVGAEESNNQLVENRLGQLEFAKPAATPL